MASSLLVGATFAREGHDTDQGEREGTTVAPSALFAIALGYSGEAFHAGLFTYADLESYRAGHIEHELTRVAVAIFAGVRF